MVYKKYIKRGNKLHGPYYYESYRDEYGRIKKRYLGTSFGEKSVWKRKEFFLVLGLIVVLLAFGSLRLTGFVALEPGAVSRSSESITGEVFLEDILESNKVVSGGDESGDSSGGFLEKILDFFGGGGEDDGGDDAFVMFDPTCGDGVCEANEDYFNCLEDCPVFANFTARVGSGNAVCYENGCVGIEPFEIIFTDTSLGDVTDRHCIFQGSYGDTCVPVSYDPLEYSESYSLGSVPDNYVSVYHPLLDVSGPLGTDYMAKTEFIYVLKSGEGDPDRDGLGTEYEWSIGTNAIDWDSDGDGYLDGEEESVYGTDPLDDLDYPSYSPRDLIYPGVDHSYGFLSSEVLCDGVSCDGAFGVRSLEIPLNGRTISLDSYYLSQSSTVIFDWAMQVGDVITLFSDEPGFNVTRTITFNGDKGKISVNDRVESKSSGDLVMHYGNFIDVQELTVRDFKLTGISWGLGTIQSTSWEKGNPTIFVGADEGGVGVVLEDDVFRSHGLLRVNPFFSLPQNAETMEFHDDSFVLVGDSSHEIEWTLYLTDSKEYYDFINLARNDEEAGRYGDFLIKNHMIFSWYYNYLGGNCPPPGCYDVPDWQGMSTEELTTFFENINLDNMIIWAYYDKEVCPDGGDWHQHGPQIWEGWTASEIARTQQGVDLVDSTGLGIGVLLYIDPFISSEPDASEIYVDSRMINSLGEHIIYSDTSRCSYIFVPIKNSSGDYNSFGSELLQFKNQVIGQLSGENLGLYVDESRYSKLPFSYNDFDAMPDYWDGVSVDRYDTSRKVISTPLASRDFRYEFMKEFIDEDRPVVANQLPLLKSIESLQFPHFIEVTNIQSRYYKLPIGHLYTAIGLIYKNPVDADHDIKSMRDYLDYGALHYAWFKIPAFDDNVYQQVYPITVREIGRGYIIGDEKIITKKLPSQVFGNKFGWNDASALTPFIYDKHGSLLSQVEIGARAQIVDVGGSNFVEINGELQEDEIVVIQRDRDSDGVFDDEDNCVDVSNPGQGDVDGNGVGDACDSGYCGDGVCEIEEGETFENCPEDCYACSDGADNDDDNFVDIEDPGCIDAEDNTETLEDGEFVGFSVQELEDKFNDYYAENYPSGIFGEQIYFLEPYFAGFISMYEATQDDSYISTILSTAEEYIATMIDVDDDGYLEFPGSFCPWDHDGNPLTPERECCLSVHRGIRQFARLVRVIKNDDALNAVYGSRADNILSVLKHDIINEPYCNERFLPGFETVHHIVSHPTLILLELYLIEGDQTYLEGET
ncbi:MAG: thrombospondin type 3 repeat-containing protein, partial [Nanoarchaeota archaeon]